MNKTSLLACLLAALLLPAFAQAQPGPGKGPKKIDTNGDGLITLAEAEAAGAEKFVEHFEEIDEDASGDISKEEMRAHRKKMAQKHKGRLKEADTDQNGALSYDEAVEAELEKLVEHFERIDGDGDGEISREEMRELREIMQERRKGKGRETD